MPIILKILFLKNVWTFNFGVFKYSIFIVDKLLFVPLLKSISTKINAFISLRVPISVLNEMLNVTEFTRLKIDTWESF